MAENVGYATLQIIPSFRGLDAALRSALGGVAPGAGAAAGAGFAASFGKALKIGAPLAVGALVGAGFAAASKAAAEFEFRISAVGAVSGATGTELDALREKALQLGADTSFTASESAKAMEELVKAGLSVEQVLGGAADAAVALAAAGEVDLEKAATIASQALNAFRLEAEQLPGVADTIAGAANSSAIDVEQFGYSLQQTAASAAISGLSFEDTATAIALLGNAGIVGSDAGTSLKTMFQRLTPQTKKATEAMELLGIITEDGTNLFYDQEGSIRSLSEVAGVLQTSFAGLTNQDIATHLHKIFGSDAIRAGAVLMREGAAGVDELATAIQKITAEEVAAARLDNLRGDVEKLKGSIESLLIEGGTPLNEWLRELVQTGTAAVNWLGDPPTEFTDWLRNAWETGVRLATPVVEDLVRVGENLWDLTRGLAEDLRPLAEVLATIGGAAIVGGLTVAAEVLADLTGFLADHRDVLFLAAGAWLGLKAAMIAPAIWGAITAGVAALSAGFDRVAIAAYNAAGAVSAVSIALTGVGALAALAFIGISKAHSEASETISDLKDEMQVDETSVASMIKYTGSLLDLARQAEESEKSQASFLNVIQGAAELLTPMENSIIDAMIAEGKYADAAEVAADATDRLIAKYRDVGDALAGMPIRQVEAFVHRLDLDPATMSVNEMADAIGDVTRLSRDGGPATEGLADAYRVLGDETASATDQLDAWKEALDAIIGVEIDAANAIDQFTIALPELTWRLAELGGDLEGVGTKAAESRIALRDMVTEAMDAAVAIGQRDGYDAASLALAGFREQLIDAGVQAGLSRDEIVDQLDSLQFNVPTLQAQLELVGVDAVNAAIDATTTPETVDINANLNPASWATAARYIGQAVEPRTVDLLANLEPAAAATAERYIAQLTADRTITLLFELDPASRAMAERYIEQGQWQYEQDRTAPFKPMEPPPTADRAVPVGNEFHWHTEAPDWNAAKRDSYYDLSRLGMVR